MRTGWPSDIIPSLKRRVRYIANGSEVYEFYIGRTTDLIASQSRHGADDIVPIYRTTSIDHALEVEDVLISTFWEHPKCSNDSPHSGGGISEGYTNYVYVAVWYY